MKIAIITGIIMVIFTVMALVPMMLLFLKIVIPIIGIIWTINFLTKKIKGE